MSFLAREGREVLKDVHHRNRHEKALGDIDVVMQLAERARAAGLAERQAQAFLLDGLERVADEFLPPRRFHAPWRRRPGRELPVLEQAAALPRGD